MGPFGCFGDIFLEVEVEVVDLNVHSLLLHFVLEQDQLHENVVGSGSLLWVEA